MQELVHVFFRDTVIARVVVDSLHQFRGTRYQLFAWCVMPNHVHVVFRVFDGNTLPKILHSWKSFSAKKAKKILGRSTEFWRREYYDHMVRDDAEFHRAVQYVINNPEKAGLKDWPWVWSELPANTADIWLEMSSSDKTAGGTPALQKPAKEK
jgi:REP element-mobilizing transposase RayT